MPAKCSPEYLNLVRTRSGLTPEHPWSVFLGIDIPSSEEYTQWRALATELVGEAHRRFAQLGDIEVRLNELDPAHGYPGWNRFVARIGEGQADSLVTRLEALPSPTAALFDLREQSLITVTELAIQLSTGAACLLEELDAAIVDYGVAPPAGGVSPKGAKKTGGPGVLATIGAITIAGAVVGGAIWYSRRTEA